ncbi:hypothetical protein PG988_012505 [Apiospora saccharicola]
MAAAQDNTMMPATTSEPTTPVVASRLLRLFRTAELRNTIFDSLSATETSLMCALLHIDLPDFERKKYINPLRELGHVGDAIRQLKSSAGVETTLVGVELKLLAARIHHPLENPSLIGGQHATNITIALHFANTNTGEQARAILAFYYSLLGGNCGGIRRTAYGHEVFGMIRQGVSRYIAVPTPISLKVGDVCIVLPDTIKESSSQYHSTSTVDPAQPFPRLLERQSAGQGEHPKKYTVQLASPLSDLRDVLSASCPNYLPSTGKKQRKRCACLELQTLDPGDNQHVKIDNVVKCTFYIADYLRSLYPSVDLNGGPLVRVGDCQ